jgi:hypothetical protein
MDTLLGYDSDSGGDDADQTEDRPMQKPAAAPSKGLLGMLPPAKSSDEPAAKKQKRTLEIGKMIASRAQGGSDSEGEDEPAPAAKPKGGGLLSFVSGIST